MCWCYTSFVKKISFIFVVALVLNFIWENMHAPLYGAYQGGQITEFILLRASLFDAFLISIILLPVIFSPSLKNKSVFIVVVGVIIATINEWYGLSTARWTYNGMMPIVPLLHIGLSPFVQLGVLGYVTYKIYLFVHARWSIV
jgi:hypothetical protein